MVTAAPQDQLALLEVQKHESRLRHLARQRKEALASAALASAKTDLGAREQETAVAAQALEDANAVVADLEAQAATVAARIAKDEAQLIAGQAGAGTLQGLQREIENLNAKAAELEDAELEALDAVDAAQAEHDQALAAQAQAQAAAEAAQADVDAEVGRLDAEAAGEREARVAAAAQIPADLLALFEATLAKRGTGAARLFHGTSEGSGLSIAPVELAQIKRSAPDAVVMCPDSGVILVRQDEWN